MNRKIKLVTSALIAFGICISMAACGSGNSNEPTEEDVENKLEEIEKKKDDELKEEIENSLQLLEGNTEALESSDTEGKTPGIVISDEIRSAEMYSGKVQLGNTVFDLKAMTVQDLIDAGAKFTNIDIDTHVVNADSKYELEFVLDGIEYGAEAYNLDEDRKLTKECPISISQLKTYKQKNFSFVCPKGITIGSTVDELLAAYGEPLFLDIDQYYYANNCVSGKMSSLGAHLFERSGEKWYSIDNKCYVFHIDLKTNTIDNITLKDTDYYSIAKNSKECKFNETVTDTQRIGNQKYNTEIFMERSELLTPYAATFKNGEKTLVFVCKAIPENNDLGATGLTEYTDESLAEFCQAICDKGKSELTYTYEYKINGDKAVAVIGWYSDAADMMSVYIYSMNEDFLYARTIISDIFPCNGEEKVTADDLTAGADIMFDVGEHICLSAYPAE